MDLVTGGCGFLGRHVVTALVEAGHRVRVLDLAAPREGHDADRGKTDENGPMEHARTARATPAALASVEYVRGDILDPAGLSQAMAGCRRVFHLAADPNLWHPDPEHFERVNHLGTEAVLRTAADLGVERVVHTSTEAVLLPRAGSGPIHEGVIVPEEEMAGPYARSKLRAEQAAFLYAENGLDVVVVNPSAPVGPGDFGPTPPTRMILDFLAGRIPAYLDARIAFVDVRDAARGHLLAAKLGLSGRRHILTAPPIALADFLQLLARASGMSAPRWRIPYPVAYGAAFLDEWRSRATGVAPRAPLEGVRLSRRPMNFDDSWTRKRLGFRTRPIEESVHDAVTWLRGTWLHRTREEA